MHVHTPRRVRGVLEGEYASVHKGRSMEFEDLRDYVPGDDVKHIDWNATARHGAPLLKQHQAHKQHAVLLVVDTGRSMAALSDIDHTKTDVAVMVAGLIGQLVVRHGDPIGLVAGPSHPDDRIGKSPLHHLPLGYGEPHLERILRTINDSPSPDGDGSCLDVLLQFVAGNIKRRTTLVVVVDDVALTDEQRQLLRRLRVQHDILFVAVGDAPVASVRKAARMVETGARVPAYLRRNQRLDQELAELGVQRRQQTIDTLNSLGIVGTRIAGQSGVVNAVLAVLERQRARR